MIHRILLLGVGMLFVVEIFSGMVTTALNPTDDIVVSQQWNASSRPYKTLDTQYNKLQRDNHSYYQQFKVPRFAKKPINADVFSAEYIGADDFYDERNKYMENHKNGKTYYRDIWAFGDRNVFFNMRNISSWSAMNMSELQATHVTPIEYFNERAVLEIYQEFGDNEINLSAVPEPGLLAMLGWGLLAVGLKKRITRSSNF